MSKILIVLYMNFVPNLGLHNPGYNNDMRGQRYGSEESSRQLENYDRLPGTGLAKPDDRTVSVRKSRWELHRQH